MVRVNCFYSVCLNVWSKNGEICIDVLPPTTPPCCPRVLHPYDLRSHRPQVVSATGPCSPARNTSPKPPGNSDSNGLNLSGQSETPTKAPRKRNRPAKNKQQQALRPVKPVCQVSAVSHRTVSTTLIVCAHKDAGQPDPQALCENHFSSDATYNAVAEEIAEELAAEPQSHVMAELIPMAVPSSASPALPTSGPPFIPIGVTGLSMVDVDPTELKDFVHACASANIKPHKLSFVQRRYLLECWAGTTTGSLTIVNSGTQWESAESSSSTSKPTKKGCNVSPSVRPTVIPTAGKKKK
eukprot:TRINITY_DN48978_c0_g1_i1.p1 TRINITY_DN48978_c0_g1~~TRINITY_DN48978_c0_g1_i1.p1  ORF type:complete len:296 (-),score=35.89 TRINITY_DN48978_c0_g1_i1:121-1008(-)